MEKIIYAVLTTIIGILLILPLLGVSALGDIGGGVAGWVIAIAVIIIGVGGLIKQSA